MTTMFDCPEPGCGRSFDSPTGLGVHRKRAHTDEWGSTRRAVAVVACLGAFFVGFSETASAQTGYDATEQIIHDRWERAFPGEGPLAVEVARCEGWNSTANFNVAHISPTSDVGPFQINQIHGRSGGIIEGRWPSAVQTLDGNIAAALELRRLGGWQPWANSRHCWSWAVGLTVEAPRAETSGVEQQGREAPTALAMTGAHGMPVMLGFAAIGAGSALMAVSRRRS